MYRGDTGLIDENSRDMEKSAKQTAARMNDINFQMRKTSTHYSILEERLKDLQNMESIDDISQNLTQIAEDYELLRKDVAEVQRLKRELTTSLREQMRLVHARYALLRRKIGPALPKELLMHKRSRDHMLSDDE